MKLLGFGGFASSLYWSSTEYVPTNAWYQSFLNGSQAYNGKGDAYYVRAVRAF
jgi:hypothetical protein